MGFEGEGPQPDTDRYSIIIIERGRGVPRMVSDGAALATHDEAIDEKQHDGTDHAREEAR